MTASAHRSLPYPVIPLLRAENAEVLIHPDDLKYGVFLAGGQGSGKTTVLARIFLNSVRDERAAPLVFDPKPELAPLCLKLTPPGIGKRLWYLDLGRPAFGMNPLRLAGDRPLPVEAAQLADNIVAALLDINENQIFQSSRRYLYHAVIGAIAFGEAQCRRAKLEDLYNLLLPANEAFRDAVAEACADQPDLDQTAEFFARELPYELKIAGSATAQRLDAPRNKVAGLVQVPALRRFFNHPTDVPLREIIEARDVLVVNANMGAIGQDNSRACMHFILRMLHSHMQRQVQWPEDQRPRVPLLIDEAHYVLGGENIVDQFATHRRAGLEPVCAVQYLAQIGSGSEHQQKILKGVMNLLQSRCLFRIGDADEAEEFTRIAMAVYSTMIRDDPDSRARLRVAPEQALNFPNHYCLASWITRGARAPAAVGQTYPMPDGEQHWADRHLAEQAERVAPYPEHLGSTLARASSPPPLERAKPRDYNADEQPAPKERNARQTQRRASHHDDEPTGPVNQPATRERRCSGRETPRQPAAEQPEPPKASDPPKPKLRPDYEPPPEPPQLDASPVRRVVGLPASDTHARARDGETPASLRELAFLDRINEIRPAEQLAGAASLPRLYDQDYSVLAFLDRAGLSPATLIGRATMPGKAPRTVGDRLTKLYRHGLIAQHRIGVREHTRSDGKLPLLYSLTRRGLQVAQAREPAPAISAKREWRAIEQHNAGRLIHDLHALSWGIELHRLLGPVATDHWRTARYATGRYPVPHVGTGRDRHPVTLRDLSIPEGQMIIDLGLDVFTEVKPDLSLELRFREQALSFDLLVELDRTARASYNRDKFLAYDAFLCGWSLSHRRFQAQGTRPAVVFVAPNPRAALALAREADEAMTGRLGVTGTPPEHWYQPGRDHMFFVVETDIYRDDLVAFALPARPPGLRERLTGNAELALRHVVLMPDCARA